MRNTSCTDSFLFSIQFKNQIYYFSDKKLNTSDDKSGKKRKQKVEKMNEKFSFLVLQVDGTNTYGLRKCLLKNSCSLIIRKEL